MLLSASDLPPSVDAATTDQPSVRLALAAALASPSHAYLLAGPRGSGKGAAARALAAELLAEGAADPAEARRRALADPSPHPDLVWLRPPGAQHLVDEVRERVIAAASYRPFEGERRAFVIEAAEAMAEESQNALLKTLEEPAPFAHLLLVSSEPSALLDTVRSRCQEIRFAALSNEAIEARLLEAQFGLDPVEAGAAARLAGGDLDRALLLVGDEGHALRAGAEACCRAARAGNLAGSPWRALLAAADAAGNRAGAEARAGLDLLAEQSGESEGPRARRRVREADEAVRRSSWRGRTEALDLGLALVAAWTRDLAAFAEGAAELALTCDRIAELEADARDLDPRRARRAAELAMGTRARLRVNVSEELALEALMFRLEFLLGATPA